MLLNTHPYAHFMEHGVSPCFIAGLIIMAIIFAWLLRHRYRGRGGDTDGSDSD